MEIKREKMTVEVNAITYVAIDGKEFDTKEACKRHEEHLQEAKDETLFNSKALAIWEGDDDLPGFLGCGSLHTVFLLKVTEEIAEVCDRHDIEVLEGELAFISCNGFGAYDDWYYEGSPTNVVDRLEHLAYAIRKLSE